jgi:hypothetical protein
MLSTGSDAGLGRRGVPSMTLSRSPGQPAVQALLQQRNIGAVGEDAEAARPPRLGGFDRASKDSRWLAVSVARGYQPVDRSEEIGMIELARNGSCNPTVGASDKACRPPAGTRSNHWRRNGSIDFI